MKNALFTRERIFAIVLFAIELLILVRNHFVAGETTIIIWLCNLLPLFLGFAFLAGNNQLIKAFINVGFLPHIIFIMSVLIGSISQTAFIGVTRTALHHGMFSLIVDVIVHLIPINIALLLTYKIKPERKSILYSIFILIVLFIATISLTPPQENVNFVYKFDAVLPSGIIFPFQAELWVLYAFLALVPITFWFQSWIYKKYGSDAK